MEGRRPIGSLEQDRRMWSKETWRTVAWAWSKQHRRPGTVTDGGTSCRSYATTAPRKIKSNQVSLVKCCAFTQANISGDSEMMPWNWTTENFPSKASRSQWFLKSASRRTPPTDFTAMFTANQKILFWLTSKKFIQTYLKQSDTHSHSLYTTSYPEFIKLFHTAKVIFDFFLSTPLSYLNYALPHDFLPYYL